MTYLTDICFAVNAVGEPIWSAMGTVDFMNDMDSIMQWRFNCTTEREVMAPEGMYN